MSFALAVVPVLFILAVYAVIFVLAILSYVLRSLGLYTMAKNTAEENPWLAWIPLAHEYLAGKMADHYTASRGKKTSYARLLLVLVVASAGLFVVIFVLMFLITFATAFSSIYGEIIVNLLFVWPVALFCLWYLCFFAAIIAVKVFQVMAHYQIYLDFAPQSATLYTILTIFNLDFICKYLIRNNIPARMEGAYHPPRPQYRANPNQ